MRHERRGNGKEGVKEAMKMRRREASGHERREGGKRGLSN